MRNLLLIALLLTMPSIMTAQRMGFAHFSGRAAGFNRPSFRGPAAYYPLPFFDSFDSGYPDAAYPAPFQPVIFMMQAASAPASPDPATPSESLMIELHGDRYVQISGNVSGQPQRIDSLPSDPPVIRPAARTAPVPQPASTILVFRDGHRQQISAYTIADDTLFAAADYYTSGSWNRTVALSSLNLPETVATNQSRGVQFRLPTAPNEVIVGP
jgi:hypothetical protein